MTRLGLIGAGGLSQIVVGALAQHLRHPLDALAILVLPEGREAALRRLDGAAALARTVSIYEDLPELLAESPDLIVECAGHAAVRLYGAKILQSGCDLLISSVGSLADDGLRQSLENAARAGGSRLLLPAGSVGGVDVLAAARLSGLRSVAYTGRKPPRAWMGTPAERLIDLSRLAEPAAFFEGTAREAARDYPQNANVAATLALAGIGFDATRVRLVADPQIDRNVHEISVESACANFTVALEGVPSPANPKTSLTAGFSLARLILNQTAEVVI